VGALQRASQARKGVSQTPWRLPALRHPCSRESGDRVKRKKGTAMPGAVAIDRAAERWLFDKLR
jgi:hypothetical protein